MAFEIRRLGPADEPILTRLGADDAAFDLDGQGSTAPPLDPEAARTYLADPAVLFWVAEDGPEVAGFLSCVVVPLRHGHGREVLLYEIGVHHGWRRQGVGGALLEVMDRWMVDHGVRDVWVLADNPGAVAFYRACGFTAAPEQPVYLTCALAEGG